MISLKWCMKLSSKHRKTLTAIFAEPVPADVAWSAIESLFLALGAEISEGRGSRVRFALHGVRVVFHRPHPQKEAGRGMVRSVRRFLVNAEIRPEV